MGNPARQPSFPDLVRKFRRLVERTARFRGVRDADLSDCVQDVFLRLHRAMADGRVDLSRSLGGWLIKVTRGVAREMLARGYARHEAPTSGAGLEPEDDAPDLEGRLAEAVDVHEAVVRVLRKLPPEQREVFVMSDLEDAPMSEIVEELGIARSTAYERLDAAREAFKREWARMRARRAAAVAPFALLDAAGLLAAARAQPGVQATSVDELLPVAKPGTVALKTWQVGAGVVLSALAGASLASALHVTRPAPPPVTAEVVLSSPSLAIAATTAPTPALDPALVPGAPPTDPAPPATMPSVATQSALLYDARALLDSRQPARALAVLARVNAPDLAEERDALRRIALAAQGRGRARADP